MQIPIVSERVVAATPREVIAVLRHAGIWKESEMPADLRKRGLLALDVRIAHSSFVLTYVARGQLEHPLLRGQVIPQNTGSRVVLRCARRRAAFLFPGAVAILAAGSFLTRSFFMWGDIAALVLASGFACVHYFSISDSARGEVQFLLDRVNGALDSLSKPPLISAPSP